VRAHGEARAEEIGRETLRERHLKERRRTIIDDIDGVQQRPARPAGPLHLPEGAPPRQAEGVQGADLREATLDSVESRGADLSGANLSGARAKKVKLPEADFSNAILTASKFLESDLQNAQFMWSDLSDADLSGSDLSKATFYKASLRGATLVKVDLCGADLEEADLSGVDFADTKLASAGSIPFVLTYPGRGRTHGSGPQVVGANLSGARNLDEDARNYLCEYGALNVPGGCEGKAAKKVRRVPRSGFSSSSCF